MTLLPVVERELQLAARRPVTYRLRFFSPLIFLGIWWVILLGQHRLRTAGVAREQFETLSILAMIFCLGAGVFLTSDCLSSENREGTLGLLFLTDLRGYDVVLGKLAANSLQAIYALLSVLPVLALPLLEGGVPVGEFWRIVLVLFTSLFFSLAAGLAVSAFCREARLAMAGTFGIIMLFCGVAPALNILIGFVYRRPMPFRAVLWPSPPFLIHMAQDAGFRSGAGEFWGSLATIGTIAIVFISIASLMLPRVWREGKGSSKPSARKLARWRHWRFGTREWRDWFRPRALGSNPVFWLTARDRLAPITLFVLLVIAFPIWLGFYISTFLVPTRSKEDAMVGCMVTVFALQVILKLIVAGEASRRFSEDRQSGALELLLISPLSVTGILRGQHYALVKLFRPALAIILGLYFILACQIWSPLFSSLTTGNRLIFSVVFTGNMAALLADFLAVSWLGMCAGMRLKHRRAVFLTFAQVLFPSWGLYLLMGVTNMIGGNEITVAFGFAAWFAVGLMGDALWVWTARSRLTAHFREWAAGLEKPSVAARLREASGT